MLGSLFDARLDLYPLLAAVLAAVTCAVLGNFLVLRRISLMGDAISHSVLPGLVAAFLVTSTRSPVVMFVGAATAGVMTVVLVEFVKRYGRVEPGAAMGVVFSVLFALGVLLIERAAVRHVDLDADCVLYGQLEMLALREQVPVQMWVLGGMCLGAFVFVGSLFKELRIAAFDPALATTQGFHAGVLHYLLMIFVAGATVASFEAVGSILVIAMLVCPAATARLLTDRMMTQVGVSVMVAVISAVAGYFGATLVPGWFGLDSVNAAGSITIVSGVLLVLAIFGSPTHGVIARFVRQHGLVRRVVRDDVLAALYRADERQTPGMTEAQMGEAFDGPCPADAIEWLLKRGLVERRGGAIGLTEAGRMRALEIVRRHRLWERYLVDEAGMPADHVHDAAEMLEHLGVRPEAGPREDPHGRAIP
jgi:manganese/zinc/iron transport system permease protein